MKKINETTTVETTETWEVETLRFTGFFPSAGSPVNPAGWWEKIVGQPPENKIERPREGILMQDATLDTKMLTLSVSPARVDFVASASRKVRVTEEYNGWMTIGSLAESRSDFLAYTDKIIGLQSPIVRFAFGALLFRPVESRIEGYKMLARYLPSMKIDIENSSDFFYQINRPRKSNVLTNALVNRLSKWSVAHLQPLAVQINVGQEGSVVSQYVEAGTSGLRLELDISTPAERNDPVPSEQQRALWNEVVSIGLEIASKGDH